MLKLLCFLLFTSHAFAERLTVKSKDYKYEDFPEYQEILDQLKLHGEFAAKREDPVVAPTMSRGRQIVEEQKARTRALIAAQKTEAVLDSTLSDLDKLKLEDQKTRAGWKKESRDQLAFWQKEQDLFLGKLKDYKANTFEIPAPVVKIQEPAVTPRLPEAQIVNAAFTPQIRDQGPRPTCSAFAGTRAVEVILAQNNMVRDLSEQYLYWASKPDCQKAACGIKGSWVTSAYRFSQSLPQIDIPTEENCGYASSGVEKNETQTPLPPSCQLGSVKIEKFKDVPTLADVIETLRANTPVIMAAKLSENFYKNKGLVTLAGSASTGASLNAHALGHAFLAVGVMELPVKLQTTEGSYCIVVANSWGKGWGAGGYSCLTENWLKRYRQPSPFVAVQEISAK